MGHGQCTYGHIFTHDNGSSPLVNNDSGGIVRQYLKGFQVCQQGDFIIAVFIRNTDAHCGAVLCLGVFPPEKSVDCPDSSGDCCEVRFVQMEDKFIFSCKGNRNLTLYSGTIGNPGNIDMVFLHGALLATSEFKPANTDRSLGNGIDFTVQGF